MDNWDNIRFLLALHRHKTMSAAAMALNTNVATVSRRVERAAQLFGAPLFTKSTSGWSPTPAAMPLLKVAEEFDARLEDERNARAASGGRGLRGRIQIAATPFFDTSILLPNLHRLLVLHPRLEIAIRNRADSAAMGDDDIVLRIGRPDAGRVAARRLMTMTFRAYRSGQAEFRLPGWVAVEHRGPNSPQLDLGRSVFGREPNVLVSLFEQKLVLMRSTGMAAIMADEIAAFLPDMAPIDPQGSTLGTEVWMVYHAVRRDDPTIRAATDWIVECFRNGRMGQAVSPEQILDIAS
jgi:DNA-binding transcriptional LysR family regulator